jgi:hypothetical protein
MQVPHLKGDFTKKNPTFHLIRKHFKNKKVWFWKQIIRTITNLRNKKGLETESNKLVLSNRNDAGCLKNI